MASRHWVLRWVAATCTAAAAFAAAVFAAAWAETPPATVGPGWDAKRAAQLDIDVRELPAQVPAPGPGDTGWPFYNRTIDGNRFSELTEIDEASAGRLEEACRVHVSGLGPFSAGSILVDNTLYTTAARAAVAIQPVNCDIVWKSVYTPEDVEIYNANRGVAYLDGRVFRATADGRVVAYDAHTGRELWRRKFGDPKHGEYTDAAPVAWDGKVFAGIAGSELGMRGRIGAFDAATGKPLWKFDTVPGPGEFGNNTWPGDSWKAGGGGTWSTFALDAATGELFVPVGNPAADFDPGARRGDNLFTSSVLVLDARSGQRRWHYQVRPNDNHDYDVAAPPILLEVDGRKYVAQASKDGFVYLIDRTSHQLAWKTAVTTQLNLDADATEEGVKICPGAKGGVEYNSPGYDPQAGLLIVGSVDWCYKLFKEPYAPPKPGDPYMGGRMERADENGTGWITALDARTGKIVWRYHTPAPVIAAVTPTAGGITFAGDAGGNLYIFRTRDGTLLRQIQTGGALAGSIVTYRIGGHQYVAVESGNVSRSSWSGIAGIPSLIVYRLPLAPGGSTGKLDATQGDATRGQRVFATVCAACHGAAGQGHEGPSLKGIGAKYSADETVDRIASPRGAMPKLYPDALNAQDIADVAAYVRTLPAP